MHESMQHIYIYMYVHALHAEVSISMGHIHLAPYACYVSCLVVWTFSRQWK